MNKHELYSICACALLSGAFPDQITQQQIENTLNLRRVRKGRLLIPAWDVPREPDGARADRYLRCRVPEEEQDSVPPSRLHRNHFTGADNMSMSMKEYKSLREENEQLRVQLAGVSMAALGITYNIAKQGDYGWSVAYQDTLELRKKYEDLLKDKGPEQAEERTGPLPITISVNGQSFDFKIDRKSKYCIVYF